MAEQQVRKARGKDSTRNRCRWSDDEDGQLVRLVVDDDHRAETCGVRKLRWDLVASALGRWSKDGHTVRHRFNLLEHWTGNNASKAKAAKTLAANAAPPPGAATLAQVPHQPPEPAARGPQERSAQAATPAANAAAAGGPVGGAAPAGVPRDSGPPGAAGSEGGPTVAGGTPGSAGDAAAAKAAAPKKHGGIPYKLLAVTALLARKNYEGSAQQVEQDVESNPAFDAELAANDTPAVAGNKVGGRSRWRNGIRATLSASKGGLFVHTGVKDAAGYMVYRLDLAKGRAAVEAWNKTCASNPTRQRLPAVTAWAPPE
ncbi:hypothetical protein WJX81_000059 [Elliptochloris bilobata]|uniref:Myb-like domain-containing protein n=1 Tax=Elliptochloris bilobata TaxID=381761 RepID=A0AAW1S4Q0_9CHLO